MMNRKPSTETKMQSIITIATLFCLSVFTHALVTSDGNNIYRFKADSSGGLLSIFDLSTLRLKLNHFFPSVPSTLAISSIYPPKLIVDPTATYLYYISELSPIARILVQVNMETFQVQTHSAVRLAFADDTYVYLDFGNITRLKHENLNDQQSIQFPNTVYDSALSFSSQARKAFYADATTMYILDTLSFSFTSSFQYPQPYTLIFRGISLDGQRMFIANETEEGALISDSFLNVLDTTNGNIISSVRATDGTPINILALDSTTAVDSFYVYNIKADDKQEASAATLLYKIVGSSLVSETFSYGSLILPDSDYSEYDCAVAKRNTGINVANGIIYYEMESLDADCEYTTTNVLYSCNTDVGSCYSVDMISLATSSPTIAPSPSPTAQATSSPTSAPGLTPIPIPTSVPSTTTTSESATTSTPTSTRVSASSPNKASTKPVSTTASPTKSTGQSGNNNAKMASSSAHALALSSVVTTVAFALIV
jgi:hypothetical protein